MEDTKYNSLTDPNFLAGEADVKLTGEDLKLIAWLISGENVNPNILVGIGGKIQEAMAALGEKHCPPRDINLPLSEREAQILCLVLGQQETPWRGWKEATPEERVYLKERVLRVLSEN